jgi:signal peptidase
VLTLAAVGGVLCMLAVVAAVVLDVSLIMFRSGSMSPGIPVGSVAAVQRVDASDVGPGDVVTVERPGRLPVTHRVVSAEPAGAGRTRLVLKGDANPGPDPEPYEVSHVGRLLFAVPGGAAVVSATGHPVVLGGLTLAVSALVTWAFWPPRPVRSPSDPRPRATAQVRP